MATSPRNSRQPLRRRLTRREPVGMSIGASHLADIERASEGGSRYRLRDLFTPLDTLLVSGGDQRLALDPRSASMPMAARRHPNPRSGISPHRPHRRSRKQAMTGPRWRARSWSTNRCSTKSRSPSTGAARTCATNCADTFSSRRASMSCSRHRVPIPSSMPCSWRTRCLADRRCPSWSGPTRPAAERLIPHAGTISAR